ncbi:MAG: hypothetical protein NBKEAIPA_02666 [Nitrospirae bacterium]|nr:MAG: hypothetical protein UZ03_NOB001000407 [Nitrospira sp. OLB3]MBV6470741.1 hypothetical protein [Nitrospirota bacterium]
MSVCPWGAVAEGRATKDARDEACLVRLTNRVMIHEERLGCHAS